MDAKFEKKLIPKKSENLSEWYNRVILAAELADYGPAKGTMIFRPYGYAIWELVQQKMDPLIKEKGVENAYFPLFIPESLLEKEKSHVEGFSPELAVVTIGGGEELEEKLVVRPTSETIMYNAYASWVQSWRDLPILINQWNNVVRWEKRTYLFLRTSEFLWQEGHTAHATHEESWEMVVWAMQMYEKIYREHFALPGFVGRKSNTEKFAGGDVTLSYESLMPDGKALQSCTSHDLGQNFSKVFGINFQDQNGIRQDAWQTSWGFSTRSIGGLLMAHGDDAGLRLPPELSPVQVIILPVKSAPELLEYCRKIEYQLKASGIRVRIDGREDESFGFRINKWEMRGVPVRLEIGLKEMEVDAVTYVRRDNGSKTQVNQAEFVDQVKEIMHEIQNNMLTQAEQFLNENTHSVDSYEQFKEIMAGKRGFLRAFWCEDAECEAQIKEETKATTRCLPLDAATDNGMCIHCGKPAKHRWIFAQAY